MSRRFLHRPRKSVENIASGFAIVVAVMTLAIGFGASLSRTVSATGYRLAGTFSYTAKPLRRDSAYPSGVARSGQPLFLNDFNEITISFSYRFDSRFAHDVRGTLSLKALLASSASSSWRNLYALAKPTVFSGDTAQIGGTFSLRALQTLTNRLSADSGAAGSDYTIDLEPTVHVTGIVDGNHISSTFAPSLPFTLTPAVLALNIAPAATLPGATYVAPSAAATLAAGLNPSQTGTIPTVTANYVSLARYKIAVSTVRGLGLGLVGLAGLALLGKLFRRPREVWSHEQRVAVSYGCVVVDVISLMNSPSAPSPLEVPDFENLAVLAQYCERPILRETRTEPHSYAVEDDGRLYIYRPPTASSTGRLVATIAKAS
jgi:hypothetical protein